MGDLPTRDPTLCNMQPHRVRGAACWGEAVSTNALSTALLPASVRPRRVDREHVKHRDFWLIATTRGLYLLPLLVLARVSGHWRQGLLCQFGDAEFSHTLAQPGPPTERRRLHRAHPCSRRRPVPWRRQFHLFCECFIHTMNE